MKKTPASPVTQLVTQTIEKAIVDIEVLAGSLDTVNANKLASDLWDLEDAETYLLSFPWPEPGEVPSIQGRYFVPTEFGLAHE